MSGHSKWATIKRQKGAADAKRGKVFSRVAKEIMTAARIGGGDPSGNPRLRRAMDLARASNMTNDKVLAAIKKGTGEAGADAYEELLYEGVGPAGVLVVMDVMTDNRNRTAAEIRKIFDKHGGTMGGAGVAGWAFDQRGVITLAKGAATEEQLFELAVGAGAEDVGDDGDAWTITTPREALDVVRDALETASVPIASADLLQLPKTTKMLEGADAEKMMSLLETLEDHDDVQKVASEADFSDDAVAASSGRATA
ncbi:MAG: YebC/PmpR family DNA-binding transcriptional regulator [Myxococcota bacterium]|nr:YebC/PmpR family DNA-binding transcriptional regulator [Myxococcota bacterium]